MNLSQTTLIQSLTTLNQIGRDINELTQQQALRPVLKRIVDGAIEAVAQVNPSRQPERLSTIIWLYDEIQQRFEPTWRISAGEPTAGVDDLPRPDGLGMRAIHRQARLLSKDEIGQTIHPAKLALGAISMACYPLIVSGQTLGLFYVYHTDERAFNQLELLLLDNFANLASLAIYRGHRVGRQRKLLAQRVNELEKLQQITKRINSHSDLERTLREILSVSLELSGAEWGSLEMYDKQREVLTLGAIINPHSSQSPRPELPLDERSVVGWVAKHRQPRRLNHPADLHEHRLYHPLPTDRPIRSELAVPLIGSGEGLEGVLNVESDRAHAFTPHDQELLETLASQAVIALQETRLLDSLHETYNLLLTANQDELFDHILHWACDLTNLPAGSIWILEDDTLLMKQSTAGDVVGESWPLAGSVTERAIRQKQPVPIDDIRTLQTDQWRERTAERGWISAIVVPLLLPGDGRAVGSFTFVTDRLRDFSDWDKKVLTCLASQAAIAIKDARLLIQLKKAQESQAFAETFAAVGDVAANLMHQLNNQLGAIPARLQGVQAKSGPLLAANPYLAKNLVEIEQNAKHALSIVREFMTHLRPIKPQPITLTICVEKALEQTQHHSAIEVTYHDLQGLPPVIANEEQLTLVFYNLIDNAFKAMASEGQLSFRGKVEADQVMVQVKDNGAGIPAEILPHIFEFMPTYKQQADSLGFGLWWVKQFMNRFGGDISVTSQPGQGTTFTLFLPIADGRYVP